MKKHTCRILSLLWLAALLCMLLIPVSASNQPKVVDMAGLLTPGEVDTLSQQLDEISARQGMDVVVVTMDSTGGKSAEAAADDYFDYNGYGPDGILLLVAMENRDWHISTTGLAIEVFHDDDIYDIGDDVVSYLSVGDYAEGFGTFAKLCDRQITNYRNSLPPDRYEDPAGYRAYVIKHVLTRLVVALLLGSLLASIPMFALKREIKHVAEKALASDYVKKGSLNMQVSHDQFIRRDVVRTPRPKDNDRSSSSTHSGSSGTSHGGGGGHF